MRYGFVVLIGSIICAGCGGQNQTSGSASYVKPASSGGKPVAAQPRDELKLTVALQGTASFERLQAALCALTSGDFSERVDASGSVDSNGHYAGAWTSESAAGSAMNPLCGAVKNVQIKSLTSLTVSASIPANAPNCEGYCSAKADNDCAAAPDKVMCTSTTTVSCKTQCQGSTRITGMGSASASALSEASGHLGGSGMVDAQVDLVFSSLQ